MHILALGNFFSHGKFSQPVPSGLRLLGFAAAEFGFVQLGLKFLQGDALLAAFAGHAEERAENFQRQPREQSGQQCQPQGEAQTASAGLAHGIN